MLSKLPFRALTSSIILLACSAVPALADGVVVPEPTSMTLLASGVIGLVLTVRRKR